jgi:zinc protease
LPRVDDGATQVSAGSLRRTFPALLEVMADVIRHPSFPAGEIDRQRASRLASPVQQRENPARVANTAMAVAPYGPSHP